MLYNFILLSTPDKMFVRLSLKNDDVVGGGGGSSG